MPSYLTENRQGKSKEKEIYEDEKNFKKRFTQVLKIICNHDFPGNPIRLWRGYPRHRLSHHQFLYCPTVNNYHRRESTTLSWEVINSTAVSINQGIGTVAAPSGSITVTPASTTTYTLIATNSTGSSTNSITITVLTTDIPIISLFAATSYNIIPGESVTLSWETSGATNVYLSHESLSETGSGSVDLSGSSVVSPTEHTLYTLTATNSAGSSTAGVTVAIKQSLTIALQPGPALGKDSTVASDDLDKNCGNFAFVGIGNSAGPFVIRAYLQFDLSTFPVGATIVRADLKLYHFDTYGPSQNFTIGIHKATSNWEENIITWNNQPSSNPAPEYTCPVTAYITSWLSWDITTLVQGWYDFTIPNYGVALKDTGELLGNTFIYCHSSDYMAGSALRPKLEITYYVP